MFDDPTRRRAVQVKFRTKQLQRCYESQKDAIQKWGADVARRYVQRIGILYAAETVEDLHRIPVLRSHPLKGNRRGAIRAAGDGSSPADRHVHGQDRHHRVD